MFGCMETPEAFRQRVRREQQLIARLRLATTRLADADRERIWAIVAAQEAGLSIRQIARATGLSPTRVHQLLQADEAREIPVWLSQLHDDGRSPHAAAPEADPPARQHPIQTRLAAEVEVLRWCIAWLERLEHEDHVVVNLRPESEEETEFAFASCVCWPGLRRTSTNSPAAPLSTLKRWQQTRRSFGLGIASGSRSLSQRRDGSVSGKSGRPYGKRRGFHWMRDAKGCRYLPVHSTERLLPVFCAVATHTPLSGVGINRCGRGV